MVLFCVIISLALEKFYNVGSALRRFNWFAAYVEQLEKQGQRCKFTNAYVNLAIILILPLLLVGLLEFLFGHMAYGMVSFVINLFILVYCLGPESLVQQVNDYLHAAERQETENAQVAAQVLLGSDAPAESVALNQAMSEAIFVQAQQRVFSVIFWFALFGAFAAVLYRMVDLLSQREVEPDADAGFNLQYASTAKFILNVLDWVPARLSALSFMLAGHFTATLPKFISNLLNGLSNNAKLLKQCGFAALNHKDETPDVEQFRDAFNLVQRSVAIWVVMIALISIGSFFV